MNVILKQDMPNLGHKDDIVQSKMATPGIT
jgi:ribosomal protein L9